MSKSCLDVVRRSPLHFKAHYIDRIIERKETAAFTEGSLFHSMVLEPHKTALEFVISPEINKRTKAGKEQLELFKETNKGKTVVSQETWDKCAAMCDSVFSNPESAYWFSNGRPEVSVFWHDSETGLDLKCRHDWLRDDNIIVDLKSTEDASEAGFARSVAKYRYFVQHAFYSESVKANRFIFVAVEKTPPYAVSCYELDDLAIAAGKLLALQDMASIKSARESGNWRSYVEGTKRLSLPPYAFSSMGLDPKILGNQRKPQIFKGRNP
nr:PD-(D/E)XK nuclease-like domain-containing protein [Photobacterium profundum]